VDDVLDLSIEIDPSLPRTQVEMRPAVDQIERRYDEGEALKRQPDLTEDAYFAWQDATADDLSKIYLNESVARAIRSGINIPGASGLREMIDERREKLLNVMSHIIVDSFTGWRSEIAAGNAKDAGGEPVLLMHVTDARKVLTRQIRRGEKLHDRFPSPSARMSDSVYSTLHEGERRFREYNLHLLKSIFDRSSVADEFNTRTTPFEWATGRRRVDIFSTTVREERHGSDPHETLRQRVDWQISQLTQIRDTLHLRPVPRKAVYDALQKQSQFKLSTMESSRGGTRVFVVHGHHMAYREALARMLERLGISPVVLNEQPNAGATIIEKLEREAGSVGYAIVLATADDLGQVKTAKRNAAKSRARQNVIFELGYFVGKLGRDRVCLLVESGIEVFSDFAGVAYHPLDEAGHWKTLVASELKRAGFDVDLNVLAL
jgi:predicted nucleotide-binding protein